MARIGVLMVAGVLLAAGWAHAESAIDRIIPAQRRMDWTPGTTVGVPGGIPNRTTVFVNLKTTDNPKYCCAGDGETDDSAKIQEALKACPAGQVVYAPAATYKLNARVLVQFNDNYTLRGDGPGKTIFLCTGGGSIEAGTHQWPPPSKDEIPVTQGATLGSTVLTVADASTVKVGNFITLRMDTPKWMHSLNGGDAATGIFRMTFRAASKTATTVTIAPKIPFDVSGLNPKIVPWGNGGGGRVTNGVGLEGFTLNATNGSGMPIKLEQAWGCWIKNVEVTGSKSRQFFLVTTCASEVRDCYTHDVQGGGPNHEGIDFQADGCWNLIENNVCTNGGYPAIILGDARGGCVGNVIAYNYVEGVNTGSSVAGWGLSDSHGSGGNMLNLIEGNVSQGFASDGYYGGSSYGMLFRNFLHNKALPQDGSHNLGPIAVNLCHYAVYYNVVGNILGSPEMKSEYEMQDRGYKVLIYRLGYPNCGNGGYGGGKEGTTIGPTDPPDYSASPGKLTEAQALDLNVKATLIRHGNFDYVGNKTIWDPAIKETALPPSLYLKAKPDWWGSSPWPAIGPDLNPMVGKIPAQVRHEARGGQGGTGKQ